MELKPGYKQTEVGVIPEDWDVVQLGDLKPFVTSGSRGWASFYSEYGDLFVRITNMSRETIYLDLTDSKFVRIPPDSSEGVRTQLQEHDVLISITADIGIASYVDARVPPPAYINQHIALVRLNPERAIGKFVSYFLAADSAQRNFRARTDNGAKAGMSLGGVAKIQTALPPLTEQSAIAEVLGDVDTLLSTLDKRIAKQRDLKQAAMQQLLTEKTRLPGFGGEWEVRLLGEVAHIKTGSRNNEDKVEDGEYPFFVRSDDVERINSYSHDCEAILVPGEGRIGEIFHYINGKFDVHQRVYAITRFAPDVSGKFVYLYLKAKFGVWAMQNTVKATVDSLRLPTFQNFQIRIPPTKKEQTAIAEVLGDMDAELAALQAQRDKTALLKQGMMQELLTGRTRLVQPVAQPASNVVPFRQQEAKGTERKAPVAFKRSVFAAEIVERLHAEPTFGHVKFQKLIYLAEHMCKVDIDAHYHRDAAGPYDNRALRSIDSQLKQQKWFDAQNRGGRYQYVPMEKRGGHKQYFDRYFADAGATFGKVIDTFRSFDTERCEIVATLYSAWNDLLKQGQPASDQAIVDQVLNHWHDAKKRIEAERWHKALGWMREKGFVPEGA